MGDRPVELQRADRLARPGRRDDRGQRRGRSTPWAAAAPVIVLPENLGVPGAATPGPRSDRSEIVGFLDDDAELRGDSSTDRRGVRRRPGLGAVALRLVDEDGETARRHVPRLGGRDAERSGDVALFLGGACAIRREAYDAGRRLLHRPVLRSRGGRAVLATRRRRLAHPVPRRRRGVPSPHRDRTPPRRMGTDRAQPGADRPPHAALARRDRPRHGLAGARVCASAGRRASAAIRPRLAVGLAHRRRPATRSPGAACGD